MVTKGDKESAPRLVRVDLNEQAYGWLRERIITRQFGPGERLGLQGLADELGVSRSPVHQALTRLVSDGLVTVSRRGYAVRPITTQLVRDALDARLALAGHGRPFTDVRGHVEANRARVASRLGDLRALLAADRPLTAYEIAPRLFGDAFGEATGVWLFTKVLAYLRHLEVLGDARRLEAAEADGAERWAAT